MAVTVVQHFDDALRRTPYDVFVERIRSRLALTGLLMTPDAAFGFERRGTPVTVAALGARDGFEVVVVPPFTIDGHEVRSSDIRAAIAAGDLEGASRLLGRPVTITGSIGHRVDGGARLEFSLPVALPPDGEYDVRVGDAPHALRISGGDAYLLGRGPRTSCHGRAAGRLTGRRSAAAEDLGCRVGVLRVPDVLVDAVWASQAGSPVA